MTLKQMSQNHKTGSQRQSFGCVQTQLQSPRHFTKNNDVMVEYRLAGKESAGDFATLQLILNTPQSLFQWYQRPLYILICPNATDRL
jgi:hypothetical protein